MRILRRVLWLFVFIALVIFAAKNTGPVVLRLVLDYALEVPLVVLLFGFFAAGALLGALAPFGRLVRQRREILRLKRDARRSAAAMLAADAAAKEHVLPPLVDG